jgi:putative heme iron utilization protein
MEDPIDPLLPVAHVIVEHMNSDHAESHAPLLNHFLNRSDVRSASMTGVNQFGCDFDAVTDTGNVALRLAFTEVAATIGDVQRVIVSMLQVAAPKAASHD